MRGSHWFLRKDQGLSRFYLEYYRGLITAVRLQFSNWLSKITGKITLKTNREVSKFKPAWKNANEDDKRGGGNLRSRYPIVDMLREAWCMDAGLCGT